MYESILALLLTTFAGVRKDGLAQLARALSLQATTEEEAANLVKTLTKEKVESFVKEYRSEVDKEVTEGNKTFESNLRKKYDFKEKTAGTKPESKPEPGKGDVENIIKAAVAEAVKPLQDELNGYKKGNLAKQRLDALNEKLSVCKDDVLKAKALKDFNRMNFESEEAFNEYLQETETDIASANQSLADSKLGGHEGPMFSKKTEDGVSSGVADYLEDQKKEDSKFSGKEV